MFFKKDKSFGTLSPQFIVDVLNIGSESIVVDCTYGSGGHAREIVSRNPMKFYVVDYDSNMLARDIEFITSNNVKHFNINFKDLYLLCRSNFILFSNVLVDLGVDISQIFGDFYGLSYEVCSPLNMVVNNTCVASANAYDVVNFFSEELLYLIFSVLGEDRFSRKIVNSIIWHRKRAYIESTGQLSRIVASSVPKRFYLRSVSNIFRALRMYINRELENIIEFMNNMHLIVQSNCRVVFVTFHSVEDRIVKNFMLGRPLMFNTGALSRILRVTDFSYRCSFVGHSKYLIKGDLSARRSSLSFIVRCADIVK